MTKKNGTYCELDVNTLTSTISALNKRDGTLSIDVVNGKAVMSIIASPAFLDDEVETIQISLSKETIGYLKQALEFKFCM